MNILDRIIADKRCEVRLKKQVVPESELRQHELFSRPTLSLAERFKQSRSGILAEHKRRSPSKSVIRQDGKLWDIVRGYEEAGACGISVLTDTPYFGGALQDLQLTRAAVSLPLLRKDFMIDPYQLLEARAYGADVVLLIAAVLDREQAKDLVQGAGELGLEILLEVHNQEELEKCWMPGIQLLGVNNRNLKTFETDLGTSRELASHIPENVIGVSESGLYHADTIRQLRDHGYRGFLIGEHFMKQPAPGEAVATLVKTLES